MNPSRKSWVDTLKAIGILAVILGHMNSPFGNFIFTWHMPFFFMISGFFMKFDRPLKEVIKKDFFRLMVPYFIFAPIGLIVEIVKRTLLQRPPVSLGAEISGIFWQMDVAGLEHQYGFVLWFLPALFFAKTLIHLFHSKVTSSALMMVICLIMFGMSFYCELPFALDNAENAAIWIYVGYLFYGYWGEKRVPIWPVLICAGWYFFRPPLALDMARKLYPQIVVNCAWAFSVALEWTSISQRVRLKGKMEALISLWGKETLFIFIVHPYTNNVAHLISEKIKPDSWYLKLLLSALLIQALLGLKVRFPRFWVFRYC